MCCICDCVDFPSLLREEVGMGKCCIYVHENGCSTYLLIKSGPQMKHYTNCDINHEEFLQMFGGREKDIPFYNNLTFTLLLYILERSLHQNLE